MSPEQSRTACCKPCDPGRPRKRLLATGWCRKLIANKFDGSNPPKRRAQTRRQSAWLCRWRGNIRAGAVTDLPCEPFGKNLKTSRAFAWSFVTSRQVPPRVLERDDHGFLRIAVEGQLQIVRVLDFDSKLAEFVCQFVNKIPAPIRERDM
jgi:hypothetical protein